MFMFLYHKKKLCFFQLLSSKEMTVARKKTSSQFPSKRFWNDTMMGTDEANVNSSMIDPNIENISSNINRVDNERLARTALKLAENYFSSDESNEHSLIIIDHQHANE